MVGVVKDEQWAIGRGYSVDGTWAGDLSSFGPFKWIGQDWPTFVWSPTVEKAWIHWESQMMKSLQAAQEQLLRQHQLFEKVIAARIEHEKRVREGES